MKKVNELRLKILFCISIALVICWMGIIFKFSSANGEKSTNTSTSTLEKIIVLFNKNINKDNLESLVKKYDVYLRKFTHFSIYLIGGILIFFMYYILNILNYGKIKYIKTYSTLLGVIYAVSDELHQYFVPGRSGELRDVILDSLGVIAGVFIIYFFTKLTHKKVSVIKV